jgi:hypothetical protein
MFESRLTVRVTTAEDAAAMTGLAEQSSRRPATGRALVAERDGVAIAAISLGSGAVFGDPVQGSVADAVRALRLRRYRLLRQGGDVAPARSLLRRLAPQPAANAV